MAARATFVTGVVLTMGALAILLAGLQYYALPLPERPFSPAHDLFAPSGLVGQGLGIVGTAMMALGAVGYGIRKRVPALRGLGRLSDWLRVHILLCLLGPFLILLHTSFKFGGIVSIAFWSMAVVVASGAFGRWVYVWIPKTANGRFLDRQEIRQRFQDTLVSLEKEIDLTAAELLELARSTRYREGDMALGRGADQAPGEHRRRTMRGALADSIRYRLSRRRERARWIALLRDAGVSEPTRSRVIALLEEDRRIEQQLSVLEPFQAAFRYWHAFHLPLAAVMLLIVVLHVGVAVAFGYTWIWAR